MLHLLLSMAMAATPSTVLPALGGPVGDMPNWFRDSDWTSSRAGGAVRFKVVLGQSGNPETCTIQATTGNKEVEALACKIVMKRFRFKPSLGADGLPASRVFIRTVSMGQKIPEAVVLPAILNLTVKGYEKISHISVIVDVNRDGTLAGCSFHEKKAEMIKLAAAACQSLKSLWEPLPEVDSAGNAIRYVRDVVISIGHATEPLSPANDR